MTDTQHRYVVTIEAAARVLQESNTHWRVRMLDNIQFYRGYITETETIRDIHKDDAKLYTLQQLCKTYGLDK